LLVRGFARKKSPDSTLLPPENGKFQAWLHTVRKTNFMVIRTIGSLRSTTNTNLRRDVLIYLVWFSNVSLVSPYTVIVWHGNSHYGMIETGLYRLLYRMHISCQNYPRRHDLQLQRCVVTKVLKTST
jgi:hypothetical protein